MIASAQTAQRTHHIVQISATPGLTCVTGLIILEVSTLDRSDKQIVP